LAVKTERESTFPFDFLLDLEQYTLSGFTLFAGCQEGHRAYKKTRAPAILKGPLGNQA